MRLRHPGGGDVHLAYCTNVHPAEDAAGIESQLRRFAVPLRARLGVPVLGVGLWLPAGAAAELAAHPTALDALRRVLDDGGLEVVTLNGFPYRGFHEPVVKHAVYHPDWSDGARADYTVTIARVLAALLPGDVAEGSISTLPFGWREGWTPARHDAARRHLSAVAVELAGIAGATGKRIRLALEPEPGCTVETVAGAADALRDVDPAWVGICVDACHLAVGFEDPSAALAAAASAGVPVVKAQVSSALRKPAGQDPATLAPFVEPRFLHQTRAATPSRPLPCDDLPPALDGALPPASEWRVHFHVPVHAAGDDTTQRELLTTLRHLAGGPAPATRHFEVETYTWNVLPPGRRPQGDDGLVEGLAQELGWTLAALAGMGLEVRG